MSGTIATFVGPIRHRWRWLAVALALVSVVLAMVAFARPWERVSRLKISGGSEEGRRHRLALSLKHDARRHGVLLDVKATGGSADALDRVEAGTLDLALVQGGLDHGGRTHVREVAPLHVEPLHLMVRPELAEAVRTNMANLAGLTIDLGPEGGGTRVLAQRVLRHLHVPYQEAGSTQADLLKATDRAELAEAIFLVSSLPSKAVHHLIADLGYRLVSVPCYEALLIDLRASEQEDERVEAAPVFAYDAVIPAFTYGEPPEAVRTIGTRLLLVARDSVSPDAVGLLLDAVYSAPFVHVAYPPIDRKLLSDPPEIQWHDGTLAFLDRKPLSQDEAVDMLNNQLGIVGAVLGAGFFLFQLVKRQWRRARERGFEHYLLRVARIERAALEQEVSPAPDLKALLRLRTELAGLHDEALERFVAGALEGEELMSAFLNHVNATRDHLIRLILHERDNIEDQAVHENRALAAVWDDAVGRPSSTTGPSGSALE